MSEQRMTHTAYAEVIPNQSRDGAWSVTTRLYGFAGEGVVFEESKDDFETRAEAVAHGQGLKDAELAKFCRDGQGIFEQLSALKPEHAAKIMEGLDDDLTKEVEALIVAATEEEE